MTILIIEDDPVFAETLARSLNRLGQRSDIAHTPDLACQKAKDFQVDAIILDLNLDQYNGLDLIPRLLDRPKPPRILVLTGYASIATAIDAIKRGAFNYLPKPATARMILDALEADTLAAELPEEPEPISLRRLEWEHMQHVLAANDYNISATARALGMHRRTLQRKLTKKPVAE